MYPVVYFNCSNRLDVTFLFCLYYINTPVVKPVCVDGIACTFNFPTGIVTADAIPVSSATTKTAVIPIFKTLIMHHPFAMPYYLYLTDL